MGEHKYLYGASVQGIQGFIFQTNKLSEIVGASDLVEEICSTEFAKLLRPHSLETVETIFENDPNWIVGAAGKISYEFKNRAECERIVKEFPKIVMLKAPGITINQAVVQLTGSYQEAANELENRLRAQRNRNTRSLTMGLIGISRAPSTGLPAVSVEKGELLDAGSKAKRTKKENSTQKLSQKAFGEQVTSRNIPYDIDKLVGKNNWIAVIHADGNGLGTIVEQIGKKKQEMKQFSACLNKINEAAAQAAYRAVKGKFENDPSFKENPIIPIRPVVLGGDDLTVICRADLAIEYTNTFLKEFETQSKAQLTLLEVDQESKIILERGLTACAGIVFIKSSYPFHYGVYLAEQLCGEAKKAAKKIAPTLAPSCLLFHKVQDSFVSNFEDIKERELSPTENISFMNGPYYCCTDKERPTVDKLLYDTSLLNDSKEGQAVKSHLRQWLQQLHENPEAANQTMKRLITMEGAKSNKPNQLNLDAYTCLPKDSNITIPFYDILSLVSLDIVTKKQN